MMGPFLTFVFWTNGLGLPQAPLNARPVLFSWRHDIREAIIHAEEKVREKTSSPINGATCDAQKRLHQAMAQHVTRPRTEEERLIYASHESRCCRVRCYLLTKSGKRRLHSFWSSGTADLVGRACVLGGIAAACNNATRAATITCFRYMRVS